MEAVEDVFTRNTLEQGWFDNSPVALKFIAFNSLFF